MSDHQETSLADYFRKLPSHFRAGKVDRALVYYFSIEEEKWTVTVTPDECEVVEGKKSQEADCFLKTSKEILLKTVRGEYTPSFSDLISGKIKTNRPDLLATFKEVFLD
jgi:long-chain acyl-CoA synthetase